MKRIGPNTEPRGTPQERLETCEMWSLTMTDCVVFVREEENQESAVPEMPYMCWSLSRSIQWSIVSKAAERSKSVRRETLPESSARRMSFVILRRAVSVLW